MGKYDQYAGEDLDVPLYEGQGSSFGFSKITSDAANGLGSFGLGFSMGHNAVNGIVAPILAFRQAKQQKQLYKIQGEISKLQAQSFRTAAEDVLKRAQQKVAAVTFRAGQTKATTRVAQAASGVALGTGNTAEVMASHDIAKEMQVNQILANAVAESFGYRRRAVNYSNNAIALNAQAKNISPWASAVATGMSILMNPNGAKGNPLDPNSGSTGSGYLDNVVSIGKLFTSGAGGMSGGAGV